MITITTPMNGVRWVFQNNQMVATMSNLVGGWVICPTIDIPGFDYQCGYSEIDAIKYITECIKEKLICG